MDRGEWHGIGWYNEAKKQDETIACVGYDPRTGLGLADAKMIAAAPDLLAALKAMDEALCAGFDTQAARMSGRKALIAARAAIAKAEGQS
jgi:hypothetical protein